MMITEITQLPLFVLYIFLALLALAVGSFLNVVIYRLPLMLRSEWLNECECLLNLPSSSPSKINLFLPRSFCPACNKTIKAIHNIPLLSYLFLRGHCAYCNVPVAMRYPLVEILTAVLSLFAAWAFGFTVTLIFALLFIWLLICLFFIDCDLQLLPDSLTLSLLWLGLLANTQHLFTSLHNAVFSAVVAYLSLWFLIKLFYLLTGKIGMGNGDFKLFAAFGAWFGWTLLPLILLFSSLTGAIIGIIYLRQQNQTKDTPIAFGPFLCLAGVVALFWGKPIIKWYLSFWM